MAAVLTCVECAFVCISQVASQQVGPDFSILFLKNPAQKSDLLNFFAEDIYIYVFICRTIFDPGNSPDFIGENANLCESVLRTHSQALSASCQLACTKVASTSMS